MSTLEQLVPPLELCQQIPDGAFADSALVWVRMYRSQAIGLDERDGCCEEIVCPAPTLEEIMAKMPDMTSIQYLNDYPHWELFCPYFDRTPAGGKNAASDMLELWIRWNKKTD